VPRLSLGTAAALAVLLLLLLLLLLLNSATHHPAPPSMLCILSRSHDLLKRRKYCVSMSLTPWSIEVELQKSVGKFAVRGRAIL
jgi:hypothetical protein